MCYTCDRIGTSKVIFGYNGRDGVVTDNIAQGVKNFWDVINPF